MTEIDYQKRRKGYHFFSTGNHSFSNSQSVKCESYQLLFTTGKVNNLFYDLTQ